MTTQKNMKKLITCSPDETFKIAKDIALEIRNPLLVGVSGELGAGKTIFAKGFAVGLGVAELVCSPTFLGISEYYSGRVPFIHMDFYKKVFVLENILSYVKKGGVVLIEWIGNFDVVFNKKINPDLSVYIQFVKNSNGNVLDGERQMIIELLHTRKYGEARETNNY